MQEGDLPCAMYVQEARFLCKNASHIPMSLNQFGDLAKALAGLPALMEPPAPPCVHSNALRTDSGQPTNLELSEHSGKTQCTSNQTTARVATSPHPPS